MESSRKKVWMIGLVFTSIILLQYIQVPFGDLFFTRQEGVVLESEEQGVAKDVKLDKAERNSSFENGVNATSRDSGLAFRKRKRNASLENGETTVVNATRENSGGLDFQKKGRKKSLENNENMANATTSENSGLENGVSMSMANATSRNSGLDFEKKKRNKSLENGETMGVSLPMTNATSRNSGLENGVANATSRNSGLAFQKKKRNSSLENGEAMANAATSRNSTGLQRKNVESGHRLKTVLNSTDIDTAFDDTPRKRIDSIAKGSGTTENSSLMLGNQANGSIISQCFVDNNHDSEKIAKNAETALVTIEMMTDILLQSQSSSSLSKTATSCSSPSDHQLLYARSQIEKAEPFNDNSSLYAPLYWNVSKFRRSYELMEKKLKIYIYKEGKKPVFHQPRLSGIYASEGWFMKLLESNTHYVTTNPQEAHLFYLPFSSQILRENVYVPNSHSFDNLREYLNNYIDEISTKYPFWNKTSGADHFLVACHDWAPEETKTVMANCIKALCNADIKEGFRLGKDVSLPETYIHSPKQLSPKDIKGSYPSERHILAFYAGKMHGYVRPVLLKHWENKDPDIKIFRRLRESRYIYHMKNSKYCLCPKGYEVNSPRVVEAIMYECVPVIISDNFVLPFLEVLDWKKFGIFVLEKDIPNLKNILTVVSEKRYLEMHQHVKMVKQHFLWHKVPVKYDMFHMILHSIWYNRVFRQYSKGLRA